MFVFDDGMLDDQIKPDSVDDFLIQPLVDLPKKNGIFILFAAVPDLDIQKAYNVLCKFAREKKLLDAPAERQSRSKSEVSVHEFAHIGGFGMDVKSPFDVQPQIMKRLNESGMRNERGGPDKFTDMDEETASVIKI